MKWYLARQIKTGALYYVTAHRETRIIAISEDASHRITVDKESARAYLRKPHALADQEQANAAYQQWLGDNAWYTGDEG